MTPIHSRTNHIVGRLERVVQKGKLRGHRVQVRVERRVLDATTTDGAGRFTLSWIAGNDEKAVVELLDHSGKVAETAELTVEELVSPSVIGFSGEKVIGARGFQSESDPELIFEADGDHPLCVTSSCIPVTLSWMAPDGCRVSIVSDAETILDDAPPVGSLDVTASGNCAYTLRASSRESEEPVSEQTLEVRRYPSLSLIMEGSRFKKGSIVNFGVAISCAAGRDGLNVTILTSDPEMSPEVNLTIPRGANWSNARVRLGEKTGKIRMNATAPGYVRDGVTFIIE